MIMNGDKAYTYLASSVRVVPLRSGGGAVLVVGSLRTSLGLFVEFVQLLRSLGREL